MQYGDRIEIFTWLWLFFCSFLCVAQSGDYWRLLTTGEYELTASVKNYLPLTRRVLVTNPLHEEAYVVNFELKSATNQRNWVSYLTFV